MGVLTLVDGRRAARPRSRGHAVFDEPESTRSPTRCSAARSVRGEHPDDAELAVAGLVHDVADIADPTDHRDHDRRGAELVAPLLGAARVCLVGSHVVAKRYPDRDRADLSIGR